MRTEEFTFPSADGRTTVHARRWMPDFGRCRAVLQIAHGMIEYIERYEDFAHFVTEHGCLVVGHDHIGHGQSVVTQDEWGYFCEDHPSDVLVEDMHTLRTMTQERYADCPYFMLGHSMGSYLLRKYLSVKNTDRLAGAVLLGTGYVPAVSTGFGIRVVNLMSKFTGWHYRSRLVAWLSFGRPYRKYDLLGKNPGNSWLTKDVEKVKQYYATPCCSFFFTINGYLGLYEAVQFAGKKENAKRISGRLPLLILSGADDPVGNNGVGVRKVCEMYREAGIRDITCKLYENDRHEILNETDRQMVYRDIMDWMMARMYESDGEKEIL